MTTNVNGTLNVLQYCDSKKLKKFIYAASSSCYGIPKKYPTKEITKINPQYPYALSKWMGEELVMHWSKVYKLKVISLRFFNLSIISLCLGLSKIQTFNFDKSCNA